MPRGPTRATAPSGPHRPPSQPPSPSARASARDWVASARRRLKLELHHAARATAARTVATACSACVAWQSGCEAPEEGLHIRAVLGRRLEEEQALGARLRLALLGGHLSLCLEVRLVADEGDHHVVAALCAHVVHPLGNGREGVPGAHVVYNHGHVRVADVGGDERAEALLACRVPQLQPHGAVLEVHRLRDKVDADRRLIVVFKGVVHESADDRRFANILVAEEDELVLADRGRRRSCQTRAGGRRRWLIAHRTGSRLSLRTRWPQCPK
mmetsp:Transcript_26378/g.68110  ORF Transcript_26378/g.68110 Transcript_26378/m.68110 type:complete len:270 (+) Transcript_26378:422-1231(+)